MFRRSLAAIPSHVDAPVPAQRQVRPANRPGGNGAAGLAVDLNGFGKLFCARRLADIENVSGFRFALEIDQVNDALRVHRRLWLNAAVRRARPSDLCRFAADGNGQQQTEKPKTQANQPPSATRRARMDFHDVTRIYVAGDTGTSRITFARTTPPRSRSTICCQ